MVSRNISVDNIIDILYDSKRISEHIIDSYIRQNTTTKNNLDWMNYCKAEFPSVLTKQMFREDVAESLYFFKGMRMNDLNRFRKSMISQMCDETLRDGVYWYPIVIKSSRLHEIQREARQYGETLEFYHSQGSFQEESPGAASMRNILKHIELLAGKTILSAPAISADFDHSIETLKAFLDIYREGVRDIAEYEKRDLSTIIPLFEKADSANIAIKEWQQDRDKYYPY